MTPFNKGLTFLYASYGLTVYYLGLLLVWSLESLLYRLVQSVHYPSGKVGIQDATLMSRGRFLGMVFCVNMGFANLSNLSAEDEQGKVYALFIGDTVLVNEVMGGRGMILPGFAYIKMKVSVQHHTLVYFHIMTYRGYNMTI